MKKRHYIYLFALWLNKFSCRWSYKYQLVHWMSNIVVCTYLCICFFLHYTFLNININKHVYVKFMQNNNIKINQNGKILLVKFKCQSDFFSSFSDDSEAIDMGVHWSRPSGRPCTCTTAGSTAGRLHGRPQGHFPALFL